jgi:hypothetical protein
MSKQIAKKLLLEAELQDTYWGEIIILAEISGGFTEADKKNAKDWFNCACGKQDPRIPRDECGAPLDSVLFNLGNNFSDCVNQDNYGVAAMGLIEIERRARNLLGLKNDTIRTLSNPHEDQV